MPTIPNAVATTTNSGCGVLWVANSITSTMMGFFNRNKQDEFNELSRAHQLALQEENALTQEEKLQEELKFRQKLMDLGRKYQQEASALQFTTKIQNYQLKHFLEKCWPLSPKLPQIILDKVAESQGGKIQDLNIILLHAPILPVNYGKLVNEEDPKIYSELEKKVLQNDVPFIGNVDFFEGACGDAVDVRGGNSNIMNIHFLMNQLPTLVISPLYDSLEKTIEFTAAVWEPQASRPLIMPLFKIDHDPNALVGNDELVSLAKDKIHAAIAIIAGATRDSFMMLTRHAAPTLPTLLNDPDHAYMKKMVFDMPGIKKYLKNEYLGIIEALDSNRNPKVLEAYHPIEIKHIKEQIKFIDNF